MNVTQNGNLSRLETINFTFNHTQDYIYQVSLESHVINIIISILTVFFNSCMIKCLQANRSKIPNVIFTQLMSLSVSDVIAGFSPALGCFTLIDVINKNGIACIMVMLPFSASQLAVFMNLCVLSFKRWIILRNADKPSARTEATLFRTILYTLCPFGVSLLFHICVYLGGANLNSTVKGCLSPEYIKNEVILKMIAFVYFGMLVLINVLNILSAVTLKRITPTNTTGFSRTRLAQHRRAFKQLLTVMCVANTTTLPLIILFVIVAIQGGDKKLEKMYVTFHLQALNSLINPILYSAHITEIRAYIKGKIFACLGRKTNHESTGNPDNCLRVASVAKGHNSSFVKKYDPEMVTGL